MSISELPEIIEGVQRGDPAAQEAYAAFMWEMFQADPEGFSARYEAMLEAGEFSEEFKRDSRVLLGKLQDLSRTLRESQKTVKPS